MQSAWKVVAYVFWVGAAALGAYLLMTTHPGKSGALFLARPQAQLWILALAVQAGLWAAVAPFLWRTCREFSPATPWGWAGWVSISAVVAVLFLRLEQARLYGPGPRYPLAHHGGRLLALTIAGVVLVLESGILAMCLIWQRLRATAPPEDWNWPAAGSQAGDLLRTRERLAQVLLALGLAVGAVTLATGALRSAVLAYLPQEASQFPALTPWLFGAGATVVLAAGYFPAYFALQNASRRLADAIYPLEWNGRPDQDWYADRASFIALLKLETGPVESFRTGVVILAPLLGSLLATLLPIK
jgi:hypothetical protein